MGIFAHFASPTIFNQSIRPQHSAHTQSRTTQQANSSPISRPRRHLVSEPLWVPSQLFIPDPTSPFSPLLTLILKPSHLLYYSLSPFSKATPKSRCSPAKKLKLALGLCPGSCQVQYAKRQRQGFIFGSSKWAWQACSFYRFDRWRVNIKDFLFRGKSFTCELTLETMLQCLFRRQLAYLGWEEACCRVPVCYFGFMPCHFHAGGLFLYYICSLMAYSCLSLSQPFV